MIPEPGAGRGAWVTVTVLLLAGFALLGRVLSWGSPTPRSRRPGSALNGAALATALISTGAVLLVIGYRYGWW